MSGAEKQLALAPFRRMRYEMGLVHLRPLYFVTLLASIAAIVFGGMMFVFSMTIEAEGFEALTKMGVVGVLVGAAGLWTTRHVRRFYTRRKL